MYKFLTYKLAKSLTYKKNICINSRLPTNPPSRSVTIEGINSVASVACKMFFVDLRLEMNPSQHPAATTSPKLRRSDSRFLSVSIVIAIERKSI
ncbi:hypothetical protein CsatB_017472 [Cannabis sativa]